MLPSSPAQALTLPSSPPGGPPASLLLLVAIAGVAGLAVVGGIQAADDDAPTFLQLAPEAIRIRGDRAGGDEAIANRSPELQAKAPRELTKALSVTDSANTAIEYSSTVQHVVALCINETSGVNVFVVEESATATTNGRGPYCDTCQAGPTFNVLGRGWLRGGAAATVRCGFYEALPSGAAGVGGGTGMSIGAGDVRYVNATGDTSTGQQTSSFASSAASPAWAVEAGEGIYDAGTNALGLAAGGTAIATMDSAALTVNVQGLSALASSAATPAWAVEAGEGIYDAGTNALGLAAGGVAMLTLDTTVNPQARVNVITSTSCGTISIGGTSTGGIGIDATNGVVRVCRGGNPLLTFDSSLVATWTVQQLGQAGSAASPTYSHSADPDTGTFNVSANNWGVSTGGTLRFDIDTADVTSTLPFLGPAGAVGAPTWSFSGDPNTGIFNAAADAVGIATGGTQRLDVRSTGISAGTGVPFVGDDGNALNPGFRFADSDSGLFANGSTIAITVDGTQRCDVDTDSLNVAVDIIPTTNAARDLGTSALTFDELFMDSGTVGAPAISIGDANSGLYHVGSGIIAIADDGVQVARFADGQVTLDASGIDIDNGFIEVTRTGTAGADTVGSFNLSASTVGDKYITAAGTDFDVELIATGVVATQSTYIQSASTHIGTSPAALPTCDSTTRGIIVYKEDTDTSGTNPAWCACMRNDGALSYAWRVLLGTGTCT